MGFQRFRRIRLPLLVLAALLAGCATPKPALEQANHTARLMSLMEIQLGEFRRVHAAAESARLGSIREQQSVVTALETAAALDAQARTSAGDKVQEPLRQKILGDADGVAAIRARALQSEADADKRLDALLAPLPSTRADVTSAQAKVALMGTELPPAERFKELLDFARAIADNVKDNKKKIEEAQAKAGAADGSTKAAAADDAKSVGKVQ